MVGDRDAQLEDPARGAVLRLAILQRAHARLDDVRRRREIRLADLEVDDVPSLPLECTRACEHLEGAFSAKAIHARRDRELHCVCLLYTSPSPRDGLLS